jgi:hypothetical protein
MFESEIEMEKRQSSFGPLILVVVLVTSVVGGLGYFLYQQKRGLPQEEAKAIVTSLIAGRGPAKVSFHTGNVSSSIDDRATDPHYRLMEKAGLLKIGKLGVKTTPITLTTEGEKLITSVPEFTKTKDSDGSLGYVVPLAQRKLVAINEVKMISASSARIDYTWKWEPTQLGSYFDVSSKLVKSFPTWDRSVLIDKHGADFFTAEPTKAAVLLVKGAKGWKPSQE